MGSPRGDLGTAAAVGIEPVLSSFAGGCLSLVVALKTDKNPLTRTAINPIPSRVRRSANRCRIFLKPVKACIPAFAGPRQWNGSRSLANTLLEIGRRIDL
jgi:hypothetical protein